MKIADGRSTGPQDITVDLEFLIQHLSRCTLDRDNLAVEADLYHLHLHALAVNTELTLNYATGCLNIE